MATKKIKTADDLRKKYPKLVEQADFNADAKIQADDLWKKYPKLVEEIE